MKTPEAIAADNALDQICARLESAIPEWDRRIGLISTELSTAMQMARTRAEILLARKNTVTPSDHLDDMGTINSRTQDIMTQLLIASIREGDRQQPTINPEIIIAALGRATEIRLNNVELRKFVAAKLTEIMQDSSFGPKYIESMSNESDACLA